MTRREFVKLHNACAKSLSRLRQESRQTLNLLALIGRFPESVEYRTALSLQRQSENEAEADFLDRQRVLLGVITSERAGLRPCSSPRTRASKRLSACGA
jgi:hypothetical protein